MTLVTVMTSRNAAGTLIEWSFHPRVKLEDVERARSIVDEEHRKLGHHLRVGGHEAGTERDDQFFAGFVRNCVPQSEARSLLERAGAERVPSAILQTIVAGGMESLMLLYALTLLRSKSKNKKRPGSGVWLGVEER